MNVTHTSSVQFAAKPKKGPEPLTDAQRAQKQPAPSLVTHWESWPPRLAP